MRLNLKLPGGGRLVYRKEPKKPMSEERFKALCRLAGFGMYIVLAHVVAGTGNFFALLWFFGLTLAVAGLWAWKNWKGGSAWTGRITPR